MKQTLSTSQAVDFLLRDENARWSYQGARALVEHLEQLEEETGDEMEMDVVAIRCDYSEHVTAWEACEDLDLEVTGETGDPEGEAIARLEKAGVLVAVLENGGVIVSNF